MVSALTHSFIHSFIPVTYYVDENYPAGPEIQ